MLLQVISQSNNLYPETDSTTLTEALLVSSLTSTSVYWFRPYLAADYPEVTCDKTYFFMWSTDHNSSGGIWWGKGNNLDLSDFTELGQVVASVYSNETPFLMRFSGNAEPLSLYYHSDATDPENSGIQETRLITTTGGLLHTATWTDRGNPLGSEAGDQHLGYFKAWDNGVNKIGIHYKKGSNNSTGFIGEWQYSILAADGYSVTRGDLFDVTANIDSGRRYVPSFGEFFKLYNQWWWLGTTESATLPFGSGEETKQLVLAKANSNFEITQQLRVLNNGEFTEGTWEVNVEGFTAHLYFNNLGTDVKYATLDLVQLSNYI